MLSKSIVQYANVKLLLWIFVFILDNKLHFVFTINQFLQTAFSLYRFNDFCITESTLKIGNFHKMNYFG